ncbi:hypothetical protein MMC07_009952, partial [Pseudocyphellaria aurata]|nr:hypothetical protein [Pseudocyphellaria aurata]
SMFSVMSTPDMVENMFSGTPAKKLLSDSAAVRGPRFYGTYYLSPYGLTLQG